MKKEAEREGGGEEGRECRGEGVIKIAIASMKWCQIPSVEILQNHYNDDRRTHIMRLALLPSAAKRSEAR